MISVKISAATRKTVSAELSDTPKGLLENNNVGIARQSINLDGQQLDNNDIAKTFAQLGVEEGATVQLNVTANKDGGNK